MTHREALELCEILTDLNYDGQQTLLRPELFSKPNFNLVYNILLWLAQIVCDNNRQEYQRSSRNVTKKSTNHRTKQVATIPLNETDIIVSLTELGKLFYSEFGLRLKLISLYKADYSSCTELLKVVRPIYEAARLLIRKSIASDYTREEVCKSSSSSSPKKLHDELKRTLDCLRAERSSNNGGQKSIEQIYSEVKSITLNIEQQSLLVREKKQFEKERVETMKRKYNPIEILGIVKEAQVEMEIECENLAKSSGDLADKSLNQMEKRLETKKQEIQLANDTLDEVMREAPAEYERLHKEYQLAYDANVAKYRNFIYLESCINSLTNANGANNHRIDDHGRQLINQLLLAKPDGSTTELLELSELPLTMPPLPPLDGDKVDTAAGATLTGPGVTTADPAADGRFSVTVGPAKLLDSLLDGASKPRSASLLAAGARVDTGDDTGMAGAGTGLYRYAGRRTTVIAGTSGLEFEGLLKEFVADSATTEYGTSTPDDADNDDDDDDGSNDDDDDDDGDNGAPKY